MEREIIEEKFEKLIGRIRANFYTILTQVESEFDNLTEDEMISLICMSIERYTSGYYNGYFKLDPVEEKKRRERMKKKFKIVRNDH